MHGPRSMPGPHEYLLIVGHSRSPLAAYYRCLLCETVLACDLEEAPTRWRVASEVGDWHAIGNATPVPMGESRAPR